MEPQEIAGRRMRGQRLRGRGFASPEEVVGHLGAMQAQEYAYAKWSVAQRAVGVDEAALDRALSDGSILRTHVLRPTWHFVLPEDIRWMLALTGPRIVARSAARLRELELDARTLSKSARVLSRSLSGGRARTRKELAEILERSKVATTGQRLPYLLMHAELEGLICSGPPKGKQRTYALLDERAPTGRAVDLDEAARTLALRYFSTRGPATLKDFVWWSGLPTSEARRAVEDADLIDEVVDGRTYRFARARRSPAAAAPRVDLVQVYDEIVISYTESRDVLSGGTRNILGVPSTFMHFVLLDGRLLGRWRRTPTEDLVEIEAERDLKRAEGASVERAVRRYGRFLGRSLRHEVRVRR